jgi:hypothetical protein
MRFLPTTLAAACALLAAAGARAEPELNGVAVNSALVNGNTNAAIGPLSRARQALGTINGETQVNGVLTNSTVANGNTNVSTGSSRGDLPEWGRARPGR